MLTKVIATVGDEGVSFEEFSRLIDERLKEAIFSYVHVAPKSALYWDLFKWVAK